MQQASVRMLAFAAGVLLTVFFPLLPDTRYLAATVVAAMVLLRSRKLSWLAFLILGLTWHTYCGWQMLGAEIPTAWEQRTLQVEGVVRDLPRQTDNGDGSIRRRFDMELERVVQGNRSLAFKKPLLVRLSWYHSQPVRANQRWRFSVTLQRPRGLANPGSFDYRAWLLARGIGASGKVLHSPENALIGTGDLWLASLRQWYRDWIQRSLEDHAAQATLAALAIGDKQQLSPRQRQVLTATGTAHLMVISGLHIGLCAVLGHWIGFLLASWWPAWVRAGVALRAAGIGAVIMAALYAGLAGFSLPTVRALLMVLVYAVARQLGRETSALQVLLFALILVLLLDPMAVTEAGFWLSFGAVAILIAPTVRYPGGRNRLVLPIRLQWRLLLGLCPLMALLLGQSSLSAPLVNLIAIPLLGFTIVPLLLAAMLLLPLSAALGGLLLDCAAYLMNAYWSALAAFANFSQSWSLAALYPTVPGLCLAGLAVILFLLPRGMPGRMAWPLLLLPLLVPRASQVDGLDVDVLDVGQGSSVVVRTRNHVLLYDTGPAYGGYDAGATVVLPFLRRQGIARIDRMIVSHSDTDHSGGAATLMANAAIADWMAPAAIDGLGSPDVFCRSGLRWQWDGVEFAILHPGQSLPPRSNNRSCVLSITTSSKRYLLVGDIERSVERELVQEHGPALRADILMMPHHGSHSSSSHDFVWFTRPGIAVASVGYRNRFGHPAPAVQSRYREFGSAVVSTAEAGALHFDDGELFQPYRWFYTRYWQHYPCSISGKSQFNWLLGGLVRSGAAPSECGPSPANAVDDSYLW